MVEANNKLMVLVFLGLLLFSVSSSLSASNPDLSFDNSKNLEKTYWESECNNSGGKPVNGTCECPEEAKKFDNQCWSKSPKEVCEEEGGKIIRPTGLDTYDCADPGEFGGEHEMNFFMEAVTWSQHKRNSSISEKLGNNRMFIGLAALTSIGFLIFLYRKILKTFSRKGNSVDSTHNYLKYFSYGLIGLGILQTILVIVFFSIVFGIEGDISREIYYLVPVIALPISAIPIGLGALALSKPKIGWYAGMVWCLFGLVSTPVSILYIPVIILGWMGKDAKDGISSDNNNPTDELETKSEENVVENFKQDNDIEEVFSNSLDRIEEAQDIEDKAEQVSKEQEVLEDFGEKAAEAGISEEKLETYSEAIVSEASHIEKETLIKKVKSTRPSENKNRSRGSSSSTQDKQDSKAEENKSKYNGRTMKNALIGVLTSSMLYFIPGINAGAPFIGGFVAGTLQREGMIGGIKVGLVQTIFMVLPAFLLSILAASLLAQIPIIGPFLAGAGPVVITIIVISHTLFIGVLGGFFGGLRRRVWDAMFG